MPDASIYTVGGVVQASGGAYLTRPADQELLALCLDHAYAYILTPRQLGKTSLMINVAARLIKEDVIPVVIDLTECGVLASAEEWFFGVTSLIANRLDLGAELPAWWEEKRDFGVTQRFLDFFQEFVLTRVAKPIVVFVDEVDSTLSLTFTDDFFIAIRHLYTARAQDPELRRLSFVLIGVASPTELISDSRRTPFNIGQRVELDDFTREEVAPLAAGLPAAKEDADLLLDWVMDWTGGHPYLTQRLCSSIASAPLPVTRRSQVDELVRSLFLAHLGQTDSNLQFVQGMLLKQSPDVGAVMSVYREIRRGQRTVHDDVGSEPATHLKLSGIVKPKSNILTVRNRIYAEVFDLEWIRHNWPQDWWEVIPFQVRVALLAILLLAVMLSISVIYAVRQQRIAEQAAFEAQEQTVLAEAAALRARDQTEIAESEARRAEQQSKLAARRLLTARSQILISENRPRLGALLAIESLKREVDAGGADLPDAQNLLRQVLSQFRATILYADNGQVWDVSFTPDGRWLVTSGTDSKALLWDLEDPDKSEPAHILGGHVGRIWDVAISPDGRWLATAGADGIVLLWDLHRIESASTATTLAGHSSAVLSLAFSSDGSLLASGGADRKVLLWSLGEEGPTDEPQQLGEMPDWVWNLALSSDGRWLAANARVNMVRLWDLERIADDRDGLDLAGHVDRVRAIEFSRDSRYLFSASLDRTVRRWGLGEGNVSGESQVLRGHTDGIVTMATSPDGRWLATGGLDRTARVWDLESEDRSPAFVLRGHEELIFRVTFSGDSHRLITSSSDHSVRVWDLTAADPVDTVVTLLGHDDAVRGVALSPDDRWLASAGWDGSAQLWNLSMPLAAASAYSLAGFRRPVVRVRFSQDGRRLFTAEVGGGLVWEFPGDGAAPGQPTRVTSVAASHDLTWSMAEDAGGAIDLMNLTAPEIDTSRVRVEPTDIWTHTVAISEDGHWAVTAPGPGSQDVVPAAMKPPAQQVVLWDLRRLRGTDESDRQTLVAAANPLDSPDQVSPYLVLGDGGMDLLMVLFSDNNRWLLIEWSDFTGELWDLSDPSAVQPRLQIDSHTLLWMAAFSDDDAMLATAGDDQLLELWNLREPDPVQSVQRVVNRPVSTRRPYDMAFSPDGRWLVTATSEFVTVLRRVDDPDGLDNPIVLAGHSGAIFTIGFSDDSRWLATGSLDKSIRLWDLAAPHPAANPYVLAGHDDWVMSVDFSPDGRWLLSGARDATALLWPLDDGVLIQRGCEAIGRHLTPEEWQQYLGQEPYEPSCQ